jgi:CBS domain-containing protein
LQEEELALKVSDLMTRNLAYVTAEENVMEAARLMGKRKISSVLVKHGEELSGILTDRDIIGKVVSKGLDPSKTRVSEVMSSPLITNGDQESVEEAAKKMRKKGIRRLVVERNHEQVGIIAESDIIHVDPELYFLIRERSKLEAIPTRTQPREMLLAGPCEECENYSSALKNINGRWLCENCRE